MAKTCPKCHGEGSIKCSRCMGYGEIAGLLSNSRCPDCKGMGVKRCPRCWGSGEID